MKDIEKTKRQLIAELESLRERERTVNLELENLQNISRELQRKEKILRTVLVNSSVILWATDREGIITLSEGRGLLRQGRSCPNGSSAARARIG